MAIAFSRPSKVVIATAVTATLATAINLATNDPNQAHRWVVVAVLTLIAAAVTEWTTRDTEPEHASAATGPVSAVETSTDSIKVNQGSGTQNANTGSGTQNINTGSGPQFNNQIGTVGQVIQTDGDVHL